MLVQSTSNTIYAGNVYTLYFDKISDTFVFSEVILIEYYVFDLPVPVVT